MSNDPIRIELTDEQKAQIMEATGKEASAIEPARLALGSGTVRVSWPV